MRTCARQWCVLLVLLAASMAVAAGPEFTRTPPGYVPKEGAQFWRELHDNARRFTDQMVNDKAKELGYRQDGSDMNAEDWKCMWWFNAWGIAEKLRRAQPTLCPKSFTDTLQRNYEKTCFDDGPGGPTGRSWNLIRRAILGRTDVQRVAVAPAEAPAPARPAANPWAALFDEERKLTPGELALALAAGAALVFTSPAWAF